MMDTYPTPEYPQQPPEDWRDDAYIEPALERYEEMGLFTAVLETFQQLLLNPSLTFRHFRPDGYARPLLFMVITYVIVLIVNLVLEFGMQFVFGAMLSAGSGLGSGTGSPGFGDIAQMFESIEGVGMLIVIILAIIILGVGVVLIMSFLLAGIYHVILRMTGETAYGFETTYRITAYSVGASLPLYAIPCCGFLIYSVWQIVILVIGLVEAQQVQTWRALLAVLLPFVLCVGSIVALIVGLVAMESQTSASLLFFLP